MNSVTHGLETQTCKSMANVTALTGSGGGDGGENTLHDSSLYVEDFIFQTF